MNGVRYPFGKAEMLTVAPAATVPVTVTDQCAYIKFSGNLTAATALNVTPSGVLDGGVLYVEIPCGATAYDLTPSSGTVTGTAITGVINKTKVAQYVFANGKYVHVSTQQIN